MAAFHLLGLYEKRVGVDCIDPQTWAEPAKI
jgi:hypothetical protein